MSFRALDIERDPVREQGFQEHSYDVVLASFVLHATADLENTLRNCRRLLRPGGYLVLLEMTSNDTLRLGLTMGGLEGWWLGADAGRPWSPCVGFDEWHRLLELTGFTGVEDQTPQLDLLAWTYGILVSRAVNSDVRMLLGPCKEALLTRDSLARMPNLLIVAGSSAKNVALADELRGMLRPFSASQMVVNGGFGGFVREQTQRRQSCLHEGAQEKDLTVLYLADLDQQPFASRHQPGCFPGPEGIAKTIPQAPPLADARGSRRPTPLRGRLDRPGPSTDYGISTGGDAVHRLCHRVARRRRGVGSSPAPRRAVCIQEAGHEPAPQPRVGDCRRRARPRPGVADPAASPLQPRIQFCQARRIGTRRPGWRLRGLRRVGRGWRRARVPNPPPAAAGLDSQQQRWVCSRPRDKAAVLGSFGASTWRPHMECERWVSSSTRFSRDWCSEERPNNPVRPCGISHHCAFQAHVCFCRGQSPGSFWATWQLLSWRR